MKKKIFLIIFIPIIFYKCNITYKFNDYSINGTTYDYLTFLKIDSIDITFNLVKAKSVYHRKKNEVSLFTTISNNTNKTIFLSKKSLHLVASNKDTLVLKAAFGFYNPKGIYYKWREMGKNDTIMLNPHSINNTNFLFSSNKNYDTFESYKTSFISDSIFLMLKEKQTHIILKGTYIQRERLNN